MITKSVVLACDPDRAFRLFTEQASAWWPESRRHTGDPKSEIKIVESGRFWERAGDGLEVDLGRVRIWDPPQKLVLDFYVGTDAQRPTEVTVTFARDVAGEGTRVTVDHRPTPASEEPWRQRAPAFARSWELLLEGLAALDAASR